MSRSITRTALYLLPVQVVFRTGEAILPLLFANWFGRTRETDLLYLSLAFFRFVTSFIAAAFQDSALIPVLTETKLNKPTEYPRVLGSLLVHTLVVAAGMGVVSLLLGAGWAHVRYDATLLALAFPLVVAFAAQLFFTCIRAYFVGVLNAEQWYFAHPIGSGVGIGIAIAVMGVAHNRLGVVAVPVALAVGELVAIVVLAFVALSLANIRLAPTFARPEAVTRFVKLVAAEITGGAITRINPLVDQFIANLAAVVGGATMLQYAFEVSSLPNSILQAVLFPVLLSHLSTQAAKQDHALFERTVSRALATVCVLLIAMSVLLALFAQPLVSLLFLHGAMDEGGIAGIVDLLPYALSGVAPFGALLILARAHVALQNTRIMVSMGLLNAALNAILNVLFFKYIGLRGIALSTSVMHLVVAVVFWIRLKQKLATVKSAATLVEEESLTS